MNCPLPRYTGLVVLAQTAAIVVSAAQTLAVAAGTAEGRIMVWPAPGGEVAVSPDYVVTIRRSGQSWTPATFRSSSRAVDKTVDPEGQYSKLSFLARHSLEPKDPEQSRDTVAHSWTQFDFDGGPVEVEVKIKRPLPGVTLPLRSAAVLPSALGIKARVEGGDTIPAPVRGFSRPILRSISMQRTKSR